MRIIKDMSINIVSSALPILILQFLIFPQISLDIGKDNFGEMVVIITLFTIVGFPIGNSLNNIKLLEAKNTTINKENDFGQILILGAIFSSFLLVIINLFFIKFNLVLILIITILLLLMEFLTVEYRIKLNFKGIFFTNVFLVIGYLVGLYLFRLDTHWEYIYILGYLFAVVFIFTTSNAQVNFSNLYKKSDLFKSRLKSYSILYGSNLLRNIVNHADKIIIYPLLGPIATGIYYIASILGKVINMIVTPLNTVLLSYLVKHERLRISVLNKILFYATIFGVLMYFILIYIMKKILIFIYPSYYTDVVPLLMYTIITAVITSLITLITSFNLKFNNIVYQIWISIFNLVTYFVLVPILAYFYLLKGYVIGILILKILNFTLSLILLYGAVLKSQNDK